MHQPPPKPLLQCLQKPSLIVESMNCQKMYLQIWHKCYKLHADADMNKLYKPVHVLDVCFIIENNLHGWKQLQLSTTSHLKRIKLQIITQRCSTSIYRLKCKWYICYRIIKHLQISFMIHGSSPLPLSQTSSNKH